MFPPPSEALCCPARRTQRALASSFRAPLVQPVILNAFQGRICIGSFFLRFLKTNADPSLERVQDDKLASLPPGKMLSSRKNVSRSEECFPLRPKPSAARPGEPNVHSAWSFRAPLVQPVILNAFKGKICIGSFFLRFLKTNADPSLERVQDDKLVSLPPETLIVLTAKPCRPK